MSASKSITFVATGATLDEIKRRTADGTPNSRAVLDMLEQAVASPAAAPGVAIDPAEPQRVTSVDELVAVIHQLFGDLSARAEQPDMSADLSAAIERAEAAEARAEAAEAKLAKVQALFG